MGLGRPASRYLPGKRRRSDRTGSPAPSPGKAARLVQGTGTALRATPGGPLPGSLPVGLASDLAGASLLATLPDQPQDPDPLPAGPAAQRQQKRRFGLSTGLSVGQKSRLPTDPVCGGRPGDPGTGSTGHLPPGF